MTIKRDTLVKDHRLCCGRKRVAHGKIIPHIFKDKMVSSNEVRYFAVRKIP